MRPPPLALTGALLGAMLSPVYADKSSGYAGDMVRIPGANFRLGSAAGEPDERPVHRVTLGGFWLDRREVTRAQYLRCVAAGACPRPRAYPGQGGGELPVVGVDWRGARAHCRWAGKRLPTEAEWELAARGRAGRRYPWGDTLSCGRANFGNYAGAGRCAQGEAGAQGANPGRVLPPGSRPAGRTPEGVDDLGGNVWEWVADRYAPYPKTRGGRVRGRGAARGPRVVRGGSCCSYFVMPRAANRLAFPETYLDRDIGFRCAADRPPNPGLSSPAPKNRRR